MSAAASASRARSRRILRFAARVLVQSWWFELILPRIALRRIAERSRAERLRRDAERFHALALELGGLMIKVGQFLSSRLDVLPPEITRELEGLQDEVPAIDPVLLRRAAEEALGMPLARGFAFFDEVPLAAASLGQAHRARLHEREAQEAGFTDVVVKVQRPGIAEIVEVDLAALRRIAQWLSRVRAVADRIDAPALVAEFATASRAEIDYLHEACNAERFAADFADDPQVAAPAVVWERTTRRILTLADVSAIKVTDVDALRAAGIDPHEVALAFAHAAFAQFFTHGFFHADPHPGNVFVTPSSSVRSGSEWRLTFIDFGMMGEIDDTVRTGLRKVLLAVAARDSPALLAAFREVGVLLPGAETTELEQAVAGLFERFGGMGFAQLRTVDPKELERFGREFSEMARGLPVQFPESFLLVIRAASLVSGVCSALDPEFNMWDAVEPYAATLLREESGGIMRTAATQLGENAMTMWRMPGRVDRILTRIEEGRISVDLSRLDRRLARLEGLAQRAISGIVFAGLLIGGVLLRGNDGVLSTVLLGVSVLPLALALFGGRRPR